MEKYAVEENVIAEEEKAAGDTEKACCPVCSTPLRNTNETGVLLCPKCGSKPFEEKR